MAGLEVGVRVLLLQVLTPEVQSTAGQVAVRGAGLLRHLLAAPPMALMAEVSINTLLPVAVQVAPPGPVKTELMELQVMAQRAALGAAVEQPTMPQPRATAARVASAEAQVAAVAVAPRRAEPVVMGATDAYL